MLSMSDFQTRDGQTERHMQLGNKLPEKELCSFGTRKQNCLNYKCVIILHVTDIVSSTFPRRIQVTP